MTLQALDSARLDAELLLAYVLQTPRSTLYAHPRRLLQAQQQEAFEQLIQRRLAGEPLAYITGESEFWSLPLRVTPDTLIPRPETERLVELALTYIPADLPLTITDLGTGTGAIAIAIAHERPLARITATDISSAALTVAMDNAEQHGCRNIEFHHGAWFAPLNGFAFDIIVSNPPYVAAADPALTSDGIRYEPHSALAAGVDGLDDLRTIIAEAGQHMNTDGWLLVEHGARQAEPVADLFWQHGYQAIACHDDNAGLARVSLGRYVHCQNTVSVS